MFESDGVALTTLHHVKSVQTPWVWLMGPVDDKPWRTLDLDDFARGVQKLPRVDVPLGIYGARVHESKLSCVPQTNRPEPVAFLVPPFLAPTSLLLRAELGVISGTSGNIWASLGGNIARVTGFGMGGALAPTTYFSLETCHTPHTWTAQGRQVSKPVVDLLDAQLRLSAPDAVRYAFMLPNMQSLHLLAPTACRMIQNGHDVHISIRTNSSKRSSSRRQLDFGCHLHYYPDAPTAPNEGRFELAHSIDMWCLSVTPEAKVIIATELDDDFGRDQLAFIKRLCPGTTAAINLPFNDLQDSEWLSMLTPQEWQAWNTPQIELAVVTHDRPWSLARLLNSIKRAHYFGDAVNIVINLEQTADLQTRRIAETFSMNLNGGHVAVRHRIVHAGLMTAVVESWHPHGNHSYGVILEDDVELSPMFYAWIKFCVLRYRYDTRNNQSSQLYGVSLYQPKVTELRMEGRRMFDPKGIFSKLELEYPHTPYLSQVPCSWGAVYFPEHWREFQRYLALRLSEYSMPKFFNEMVFLRGYVSLYPNYVHFVSLSTNHLEMGEHVPANVNQEKQAQYFLPLMQDTAIARLYPETERGVKFLDLPAGNLPLWSTLPVLDLWGDVSSLDKLQAVGLAWRANMSACNPDESYEDALQFLCPFGKNTHSFSKLYGPLSSTTVDDDGPDLMQG
ncbi:hypothetical protein FRC09_016411 [Ceratobasidium sp. 395]|nr:hypothetical protein FRC09_016411 [Ceratobasidium sp. 395]